MKLAKGLFPFLFLSLIFHTFFLIYRHQQKKASVFNSNNQKERVTKIKFQKEEPKNHQLIKEKKLQIVETEKDENREVPKDHFFLSENNQKVSRQTVAKKIAKFNEGGQGNSKPIVADQAQTSAKSKADKKPQKGVKDLKLSDLAIAPLEVIEVNKKPVIAEQSQQAQHGKGKGVSSSNDFVEELPLGDFTKMNTVEFKHFGFYQRIKHKLEQYWGASLRENAEKIFKQGRKLAAENYITSLVIEMDPNGQIVHVHVKGSSGVSELDDAAIDSFNKAGPFPNPPKDLIHAGRAKIEWGFVVKS